MKTFKAAVIGVGFIGVAHVEALRRIPGVEVVAIVDRFGVKEKAESLGVPYGFEDYKEMFEVVKPDCVHVCTPNSTHREIALYAFERGCAVICEKPMTTDAEEAEIMVEAAKKSGMVNAINLHNRYYPMPHHLRNIIKDGELGDIFSIQGGYLQDWLALESDFSWKVQQKFVGKTRMVADLGTHWIDLSEYVTGHKVTEVFGEFKTVYPTRKNVTKDGAEDVPVDTEDMANIMLRYDNGAVGSATVSSVFAGKKNQTVLQVAGSKASAEWDTDRNIGDLRIGYRNEANRILTKDPSLVHPDTKPICSYPGGHVEGFPDAFKQNFTAIYNKIRGIEPANPFATFEDGAHLMKVCDAIYESAHEGRWVKVN